MAEKFKKSNNLVKQKVIQTLESFGKNYWTQDFLLIQRLKEDHGLVINEKDLIDTCLQLDEVVIAPRGPHLSESTTCLYLSKNLSKEKIEKYRNPETYRSHNISTPNKYLDKGIYSGVIK